MHCINLTDPCNDMPCVAANSVCVSASASEFFCQCVSGSTPVDGNPEIGCSGKCRP